MIAECLILSLYFINETSAAIPDKKQFSGVVRLGDCSCGVSHHDDILSGGGERIIGGSEATPHMFPWIVRLEGGCAGDVQILHLMICAPGFRKEMDNFSDSAKFHWHRTELRTSPVTCLLLSQGE